MFLAIPKRRRGGRIGIAVGQTIDRIGQQFDGIEQLPAQNDGRAIVGYWIVGEPYQFAQHITADRSAHRTEQFGFAKGDAVLHPPHHGRRDGNAIAARWIDVGRQVGDRGASGG